MINLEDKLTFLKNCLEDNNSHLPGTSPTKIHPNNKDVLRTCYYHINSLNDSLTHDDCKVITNRIPDQIELPKIMQRQPRRDNQASCSLLSQANKLFVNSKLGSSHETTILSMLRSSPNISTAGMESGVGKKMKQNKFRNRPCFKSRNLKTFALGKSQRYFEDRPFSISPQVVSQLGFYQAGNIFKSKNIADSLMKLQVVAQKPQFNLIRTTNKHELFLTNVQNTTIDFCVEQFIQNQLSKQKQCQKIIQECNSIRVSKEVMPHQLQEVVEGDMNHEEFRESEVYVTIKDYLIVKDQHFFIFKAKQLQNWGQILLNIHTFCQCLASHKISCLKIKSDKMVQWSGRKLTFAKANKILQLQIRQKPMQKIKKICSAFVDRLKVKKMRDQIARKNSLAMWVTQRMKTFTILRKLRTSKIQRAYSLHRSLINNMQWQVQIHLPSFSMDHFKRNTTQYLQSIQNKYHAIWKTSDKHLIIVLPTINQNLLKLLQSRIKIKRTITIICPEIHQTFPTNLSLAAQVLFSYETLKKITDAIGDKTAVLVPGSYDSPTYQLLLSEYLNAPLLCSLLMKNDCSDQKNFFKQSKMKTPSHCIIPPRSSFSQILQKMSILLLSEPHQRKWIIKLNGEFKGRGIATVNFNPSKHVKKQNSQQNLQVIKHYLKTNLKLKLKINFQNSLFMVDDFIAQLQQKGGVIQQTISDAATYQLCFKKIKNCEFVYSYRVFGIDYSNKVWLSKEVTPQLTSIITRIQQTLEQKPYYGFMSVTICKNNIGQIFGIDLKLNQTYSSSIVSLIHHIEQRRNITHAQAYSVNHLPTRRLTQQEQTISKLGSPLDIPLESYKYLVIPDMVFTDIDEEIKAKFIEQLMYECWMDRHLKIYDQSRIFLSMGVDFSILLIARDVKKLKKKAIDIIRELTDRTSSSKQYRGKQVIRDVFRYGDIIRAITQIKGQQ